MTYLLQTERTVIDSMTLDDADFIVELVNTPDWLRFIGDPQVKSADDARRYLQAGFLKCYQDNGFGYYLVRARDLTPVGVCGFLKKDYLDNVDFGFALHPHWYGRGFALESTRAVLQYGVDRFQFSVLDAVTSPLNLRSKRLLCRLGFSDYGTVSIPGENELLDLYRWREPGQQACQQ